MASIAKTNNKQILFTAGAYPDTLVAAATRFETTPASRKCFAVTDQVT